ncbi:hypothetical protein UFOVP1382_182 [uncultured Caudovirales phage]|uniref:Uncharacterized protein n=1 Tax=uncultured Caudovirales phage TaxID=2100421 RepID=A0A6J5S5C4_9CAUD|nr:hypothetical protein UFOVP1382_182 [uncultured Caudovirales phage]
MIEVASGKSNSSRTAAERDDILRRSMSTMTPAEKAVLADLLEETLCGGGALLMRFEEEHFAHQPVTIHQFLFDDYYMGISASTLYPLIRQDLHDFGDTGPYSEAVLGGAIGVGKSTMGTFLACWMLYLVSCLKEPQRAYGLSPGSEIHFALISKNLSLARAVLLSAVMEKIKLSPYFMENFKPKERLDGVKFPRGIVLQLGSIYSERILGLNLFGFLFDEANFAGGGRKQVIRAGAGEKASIANFDPAERMYATLDRRIKSRFMSGGRVPCLSVLMSSKTTKNSFMERRIRAAETDPDVFVREHSPWDVKPGAFTNGRFRVLVGSLTARTRILGKDEEVSQRFLDENSSYIIDVPEEYRTDFERDLASSVQDIAGASTDAMHSFLSRQETVYAAIDDDRHHPFSVMEWQFGTEADYDWPKLCKLFKRKLKGGHEEFFWKPRLNPEAPRHAHIDTSLSGDCTGITVGHVSHWVEVVRMSPGGEQFSEIAPFVVADFILKVVPPAGEHIFLPDIRRLIYDLIEHGFQITSFSCDTYQSAEMLQQMKARGLRAEIVSVDRNNDAYDALKSALYEERVSLYDYPPLTQELLALERTVAGKVDHPLGGSKDAADSLAATVLQLQRLSRDRPLAPSAGYDTGEAVDEDPAWVLTGKARPAAREEPAHGTPTAKQAKPTTVMPFISG